MSIVTTYVCDISGKSGTDKNEFVKVDISSMVQDVYQSKINISKLIHIDVAKRLNLTPLKKDEPAPPEVSLEGKLKALLVEYVDSIVGDAVSEHMSNYNR